MVILVIIDNLCFTW